MSVVRNWCPFIVPAFGRMLIDRLYTADQHLDRLAWAPRRSESNELQDVMNMAFQRLQLLDAAEQCVHIAVREVIRIKAELGVQCIERRFGE